MVDSADSVELRGTCPRETVDVLDAVSAARGLSRMQVVNEVLSEWARQQLHVATVLGRVLRGNPALAEAIGRVAE